MATLTVQSPAQDGTEITLAAAAETGDKFAPGDSVFFRVANGGAGSITATVDSPAVCNQGGTHDVAIVVAAGETEEAGPFPSTRFRGTDGLVAVTYSDHTDVTVAAVRY